MDISLLKKTSAYVSLKNDICNHKLNHAYLIISEDKEARKNFFLLAAISIMCPYGGCYECAVCKKIIEKNSVDTKFFDAEEKKINVEDVNSIIEDTMTKGIESEKKLYFIDNAEKLSVQVQNKLLKTYEEPNSYVTIFLGTSNESSLLNTIKSRGKRLHIESFSTEDIMNSLIEDGIDKNIAQTAAVYAQGSFEKAEKMAADENYQELFESCFELLLSLKSSKQIVDYIFLPIFDKENITKALDFFEIILSDVLILSSGAKVNVKTINRDFDLKQLQKGFSPTAIAMSIITINEGRKRLNFNVNATNVIEKILFDILEAKYKWQ